MVTNRLGNLCWVSRILGMVKTATNWGRSGVQDWLIQRGTAIVLAGSAVLLAIFWMTHSPLHYEAWKALFAKQWVQYIGILSIFSLLAHTWIGVWTITTDYIKPVLLRVFAQGLVMSLLIVEMIWGIRIIWDV